MNRARQDLVVPVEAADHALAFDRGGAVTVVTRLPHGLARRGGCGETTLTLSDGMARRVAELLGDRPAVVLVPEELR